MVTRTRKEISNMLLSTVRVDLHRLIASLHVRLNT